MGAGHWMLGPRCSVLVFQCWVLDEAGSPGLGATGAWDRITLSDHDREHLLSPQFPQLKIRAHVFNRSAFSTGPQKHLQCWGSLLAIMTGVVGGCWHPEGGGHGHGQCPTAHIGCPPIPTHTTKDDLAQAVSCAQAGRIRCRLLRRLRSQQAGAAWCMSSTRHRQLRTLGMTSRGMGRVWREQGSR